MPQNPDPAPDRSVQKSPGGKNRFWVSADAECPPEFAAEYGCYGLTSADVAELRRNGRLHGARLEVLKQAKINRAWVAATQSGIQRAPGPAA